MRSQRLIAASSSPNVCALCACRLSAQAFTAAAPVPATTQRRVLSASASLNQDPGQQKDDGWGTAFGSRGGSSARALQEREREAMRARLAPAPQPVVRTVPVGTPSSDRWSIGGARSTRPAETEGSARPFQQRGSDSASFRSPDQPTNRMTGQSSLGGDQVIRPRRSGIVRLTPSSGPGGPPRDNYDPAITSNWTQLRRRDRGSEQNNSHRQDAAAPASASDRKMSQDDILSFLRSQENPSRRTSERQREAGQQKAGERPEARERQQASEPGRSRYVPLNSRSRLDDGQFSALERQPPRDRPPFGGQQQDNSGQGSRGPGNDWGQLRKDLGRQDGWGQMRNRLDRQELRPRNDIRPRQDWGTRDRSFWDEQPRPQRRDPQGQEKQAVEPIKEAEEEDRPGDDLDIGQQPAPTKPLTREERLRQARLERMLALEAEEEEREDKKMSKKQKKALKKQRRSRRDEEEELEDEGLAEESRKSRKAAAPTPISLPDYVSVANLATALNVRYDNFVAKMQELGYEDIQADAVLNYENASLIAMEYNFEPIADVSAEELDLFPAPPPEDPSSLPPRPPVVTIMGHVDHGKTTILDFLRQSSVAATEFGGITQHIGAFSVPLSSGKTITFLDTPGHAAFLAMRQRGANVTDIVVLVVAADDSVKPQTLEAIRHAQNAGVPLIVAINKIDKPEAAPDQVKQDLARHGVEVEDFGGDTQVVCVSGKTGEGMPDLEEAITTLSEILDHRADPQGNAEGWILESKLKKSGKVATVLVRRGTLRPGDVLVAGTTWAKVRTLRNEAGVVVDAVGPGMPVEVEGWRDSPVAGDEVLQAEDEQRATEVVEYREEQVERRRMSKDMEAIEKYRREEAEKRAVQREKERKERAERQARWRAQHQPSPGQNAPQAEPSAATSEDADAAATADAAEEDAEGTASPTTQTVAFVIKADVSGSAEAVEHSVLAIGNNEIAARVLRAGVGPVSEFDVEHAAAAGGHVIAFNTRAEPHIRSLAKEKGVRIVEQNVIYRLADEVKAVLEERLPPLLSQKVVGEADVAQLFAITLKGKGKLMVAGCKVRNGTLARNARVKVFRGPQGSPEEEVVYDGTISSLKSQKKEVAEMRKGTECGLGFDGWEGFREGDRVQCYEEVREKRYL